MNNLIFIGTSHVARESVKKVRTAIQTIRPAIVAVELDAGRLHALMTKQKSSASPLQIIRRVGVQGYLFSLIGGWFERTLGEKLGVQAGSDMLTAVHEAHAIGSRVALIDQDIQITLRKLSNRLTWTEKRRLAWDVISAPFSRQKIPFDVASVPNAEILADLLKQVRGRYPNIYDVLVTERNHVMARRLARLCIETPDKPILAVIGAGHEEELTALVQRYINQLHPKR